MAFITAMAIDVSPQDDVAMLFSLTLCLMPPPPAISPRRLRHADASRFAMPFATPMRADVAVFDA